MNLQDLRNKQKAALVLLVIGGLLTAITYIEFVRLESGKAKEVTNWNLVIMLYDIGGKYLAIAPYALVAVCGLWALIDSHVSIRKLTAGYSQETLDRFDRQEARERWMRENQLSPRAITLGIVFLLLLLGAVLYVLSLKAGN